MSRECESCGVSFGAKSPRARFCSDRCRKRAQRTPAARAVKRGVEAPVVASVAAGADRSGLFGVTSRQLEAVDRLDTVLGQQALALAARIVSPVESGASVASLSKEFRAVMAEALEGVAVAADPMDELRRRRDLKRAAG